ncbi:DUF397 domain-containing protein [Streptomyces antibioticus]|uniref:DUF397 domain-containing protein n=1 Tax=Streptomyces antibioticus TaxID=1890 RepID=A0AAE6Y7Z8_STRAT|nr:DUF397 domain-containing protein [Streptomyces antibioticus]OOQ51098.1 hypothetical protein AFM16_17990 [Streptomyces antibioticus]QIT45255.1 DUF397 domain-containing protein [Streptomyces antibioticus]
MSVQWQKSSFSGAGGENCVELADVESHILLREGESPATELVGSPVGLLGLIREIKSAARHEPE